MLTPVDMARIVRANWPDAAAPTTAAQIEALLARPDTLFIDRGRGFVIIRVAGAEADIHSIEVAPTARRQGIGTDLLQEAQARLGAMGVTSLFLEVQTDNQAALGLYEKAGFHVVGTRRKYYRKSDGTFRDAYTMTCPVGRAPKIAADGEATPGN